MDFSNGFLILRPGTGPEVSTLPFPVPSFACVLFEFLLFSSFLSTFCRFVLEKKLWEALGWQISFKMFGQAENQIPSHTSRYVSSNSSKTINPHQSSNPGSRSPHSPLPRTKFRLRILVRREGSRDVESAKTCPKIAFQGQDVLKRVVKLHSNKPEASKTRNLQGIPSRGSLQTM